ncbi:hypothetical protein [Kutzneria albida]|uniref:Uncharacterized protein n=1 Tax=Kutzneria albida DSM 43870 TaxID=1449976 RepID=W5WBR1_9PSEU|nr:hypothetical protein [Kutzneria albida]AHH98327.1 hypothetical protein KALB_4965 [Kutzneria albida DSM 43870]
MPTEYCDRYTYFQVYGHYPPDDGSRDPALDENVDGESQPEEPTTKVVTPVGKPKPRKSSRVAETK